MHAHIFTLRYTHKPEPQAPNHKYHSKMHNKKFESLIPFHPHSPQIITPLTKPTTPTTTTLFTHFIEQPAETPAGKPFPSLPSSLAVLLSSAAVEFPLSAFGNPFFANDGAGAGALLGSTRSRGRSTLSTWYIANLLSE